MTVLGERGAHERRGRFDGIAHALISGLDKVAVCLQPCVRLVADVAVTTAGVNGRWTGWVATRHVCCYLVASITTTHQPALLRTPLSRPVVASIARVVSVVAVTNTCLQPLNKAPTTMW